MNVSALTSHPVFIADKKVLATTVEYLNSLDVLRISQISRVVRAVIQEILKSITFGWSFENKERFFSLKMIYTHLKASTWCFGFHPFKITKHRELSSFHTRDTIFTIWYRAHEENNLHFMKSVIKPFLRNILNPEQGGLVSESPEKQSMLLHFCRIILEKSLSQHEEQQKIGNCLLDLLKEDSWSCQHTIIEMVEILKCLYDESKSSRYDYQGLIDAEEKFHSKVILSMTKLLETKQVDEKTRSYAVEHLAKLKSGVTALLVLMVLELGAISEEAEEQTLIAVSQWKASKEKTQVLEKLTNHIIDEFED